MFTTIYGGNLLLKAEKKDKNQKNKCTYLPGDYPFDEPKVYIEGRYGNYDYPVSFKWNDDSTILIRDKKVIEYTKSNLLEFSTKDKDGRTIWVDGRKAAYTNACEGISFEESRDYQEYTVTEYDMETSQKKKYKMVLEETSQFSTYDFNRLSKLVDFEMRGNYFDVSKNGELDEYEGNDPDLVIPDSVKEIFWQVFSNREFDSITIPKTLVSLPYFHPSGCKVKQINVAEDNPKYYSENGCLIDRETSTLIWGYACNTIPDDGSVKKIGDYAFRDRENLESIAIPNTVTEIGSDAFEDCINLKNITIPNSVVKIGSGAFAGCEKLKKIKLPTSLTHIDDFTFANCTSLENVHIPDSVQTIGISIFLRCDSLKSVDLPENCTNEIKEIFSEKLIKENDKWSIVEPKQTYDPSY